MKDVYSNVAYDFLRKRILNGEYPSGKALMTYALALEIGVSRTPVRDALRQLEADGLVTIQPRLGASVKMMDLKNFRESCELRLALETHAAGLAARNHADVALHEISLALGAMRRITAKMIDSGAPAKFMPALVREDVRFHLAIISAAKNDLMKKEILRLHLINRVVSTTPAGVRVNAGSGNTEDLVHRAEVLKSHEQIYEAIAAGDATAAKKTMEAHIQEIIDRSLHRLARANEELMTRELSAEAAVYNV